MKAGGHRSRFTPKLSLKSADIELTYAYVSIWYVTTDVQYAESVNDVVVIPSYAKSKFNTHSSSRGAYDVGDAFL